MSRYDHILARFRNLRPQRGRTDHWLACCPLHGGGQERNPSLSIRIVDGKLRLRCFVCGPGMAPQIAAAIGCKVHELYPDSSRPKGRPVAHKITATFVYEDENGHPLYRACRYDYDNGGKSFSQERFFEGKWLAGIGPEPGVPGAAYTTRRVLYKLPHLLAHPDQPVCVVEGEGKVELLISWGLVAVCGVGGSGMGWLDCYSQALVGRRVAVLPDNDPPGYRHAERVLGSLVRFGAIAVRMVVIPGLPVGGDVVDFQKSGGTRAQLLEIVKSSPEWRPFP